MNMPGNLEAELECVSISSTSSDMGPLTVHKRNKSPEIEISEEEIPISLPPFYGDTAYTFSKGDSMTWYQVYQEFTKPEFPKDLLDRQVSVQVKISKLHYAGAHPPIFPCAELIEWIL